MKRNPKRNTARNTEGNLKRNVTVRVKKNQSGKNDSVETLGLQTKPKLGLKNSTVLKG